MMKNKKRIILCDPTMTVYLVVTEGIAILDLDIIPEVL